MHKLKRKMNKKILTTLKFKNIHNKTSSSFIMIIGFWGFWGTGCQGVRRKGAAGRGRQ